MDPKLPTPTAVSIEGQLCEANMLLDAVACVVNGEPVSDFELSIPLVRVVADIKALLKTRTQELEQAKKQLAITSLAVPLEEDLSAKIDEMLKYLAMEDGFTLSGIARLLVDVQRRIADDWAVIGSERRERQIAEASLQARTQELEYWRAHYDAVRANWQQVTQERDAAVWERESAVRQFQAAEQDAQRLTQERDEARKDRDTYDKAWNDLKSAVLLALPMPDEIDWCDAERLIREAALLVQQPGDPEKET